MHEIRLRRFIAVRLLNEPTKPSTASEVTKLILMQAPNVLGKP